MAKAKPTYKELVERQLECCVCLEMVRDPQTLQGCFHSVCSPCLDQLLGKEEAAEAGVTCPLCRTFSRRDNIRANFFIKGLVDIHVSHTEQRMCEQCPASAEPTEASCKCLDCKMHMCTSCKDIHLNIKLLQGHRILPLTEATELIVDQLVFCSHHPDKPIELYCEPCQHPVCMMCTVTGHRGHDCQTIQATLDKMVPQWERNVKFIDDKLQDLIRSSDEVDNKIEETKAGFKKCKTQIDKKAEDRIAQIKSTQKRMKEDLKMKEREEIEKLEKLKRELDEKRRDGENVMRVVTATLDQARHASLLTELTQDGLVSKYDAVKKWAEKEGDLVKVNMPRIEDEDTAWEGMKDYGLLGCIAYSVYNFIITLGFATKVHTSTRFWDVDVTKYFLKKFKQVKEIKIENNCFRMTPIKDHIWIPLTKADILICDKTGTLVNTVKAVKPISVVEAHGGNIYIACGAGCGLYVTTGIDAKWELITAGSFSDVCPYQDKLYVLDYRNNSIEKYMFSNMNADNSKKKPVHVKSIAIKDVSRLDTFIACKSKHSESVEFYVAFRRKNAVYNYNELGQCLKEYTHSLSNPFICGIDNGSNIIVANIEVLSAIDTVNHKVITLPLTGLKNAEYLYDVRLDRDGALWVSYYRESHRFIVKLIRIDK